MEQRLQSRQGKTGVVQQVRGLRKSEGQRTAGLDEGEDQV